MQAGRSTVDGRSVDDHGDWQRWLQARRENAWAWAEVEQTLGRFRHLPAGLGPQALLQAERGREPGRRRVLKGLVLLLGSGALGYGGWRQGERAGWTADLRSPVGRRLASTLSDGTRLVLNTDSAVDVAYDAGQRRLVLHRGELLVTTGRDAQGRPFLVQTPQGLVQALGTRFSVRLQDARAEVAVFEHQVRLMPGNGQPLLLDSGQQASFDTRSADPPQPVSLGQEAWSNGLLVANRQRLDAFLAELGRYREGWLHCDPAVAGLRISGTFSVDDTDGTLRALAASLPVRVQQRSRYWVTVLPA